MQPLALRQVSGGMYRSSGSLSPVIRCDGRRQPTQMQFSMRCPSGQPRTSMQYQRQPWTKLACCLFCEQPRSVAQRDRVSRVAVRAQAEEKEGGDTPAALKAEEEGGKAAEEPKPLSEAAQLLARAAASGNNDGAEKREGGPGDGEPEIEKIPTEDVKAMRERVFGFDSFFVTSYEAYEAGVLFRGNMRGESHKAYTKLKQKMQDLYQSRYELFLLTAPEDQRPIVVVLPRSALEPLPAVVPEWVAALAFGLVSVTTIVLAYSPFSEDTLFPSLEPLLAALPDGLPSALLFSLLLAAHEAGHHVAARPLGVTLSPPFFIPSWQIGSFGAITRITSLLPDRSHLLKVASAGPLAGLSASLLAVLLLLLPVGLLPGTPTIDLNAAAFHESLLVGSAAKLLYGPLLVEGSELTVPAPLIAAWAALLASALNCLPAGELDGGRVAVGLFGRRWGQRLSNFTIVLLALCGLGSDIALFWFVLIFFLQRGPVQPQADEVTAPDQQAQAVGYAALIFGMLVYLPYPIPF